MIKKFRLYSLLLLALFTTLAQAELEIKITKFVEGDIPLAIVPFKWSGTGSPPFKVDQIINSDLRRTGKFKFFSDLPEQPSSASEMQMQLWKDRGMDNVVVGTVTNSATGGFEIRMQLINSSTGKQLAQTTKIALPKNFRLRAHQVSNLIYKALTGEDGVFDTRVAYVRSVKSRRGKRSYALIVADADGYNPKIIRSSVNPIMSPSWAPDGKRLAYVAFKDTGRTAIYVQNVITGRRYVVSASKGINGAPAWSPDGTRLALTLSKVGNPEIYVFNLRSRSLRRITVNGAIDTEPAWSPDGRWIVFTSDRSGGPQIYKAPATGGPARRLTFRGKYNARPAFSPDGKKLAMVHSDGGRYNIGVLDLTTSEFRPVTDGRLDESPNFAPNGSMLIYASEYNRRGVLSTVSTDGRVKYRLELQSGDIREPAWGPKRSQR